MKNVSYFFCEADTDFEMLAVYKVAQLKNHLAQKSGTLKTAKKGVVVPELEGLFQPL